MEASTGFIRKADLLCKAISIIIKKNLAIKKKESLLIVYDSTRKDLAKQFKKVAKSLIENVDILRIPVLKANGAEPKPELSVKFLGYNAIIILTSKSLKFS